jgi:hypothetical protein
MEERIRTRLTDPQISSMLLMGRFDFFARHDGSPSFQSPPRPRGRPPRRP